jgi:hypothetical protein
MQKEAKMLERIFQGLVECLGMVLFLVLAILTTLLLGL